MREALTIIVNEKRAPGVADLPLAVVVHPKLDNDLARFFTLLLPSERRALWHKMMQVATLKLAGAKWNGRISWLAGESLWQEPYFFAALVINLKTSLNREQRRKLADQIAWIDAHAKVGGWCIKACTEQLGSRELDADLLIEDSDRYLAQLKAQDPTRWKDL